MTIGPDPLLQQLIEAARELAAQRDDISYHDDWDSIARVRSSYRWITAYLRRARTEFEQQSGDRASLLDRLQILMDEVTRDGDYDNPISAVSRVSYLLETAKELC